MSKHSPHRDVDPALGALIDDAYTERVDMEVAARHLWMIHRAAGAMRTQGRRTRKALVSVLAGGMLFMSSGGAVAASSHALPGDMLYTVKRGVEAARIVLTVTPEGDARLYLSLAQRRMAEMKAAAAKRPEVVPELMRDAQDSLQTAERKGGTKVAMQVQEATEQLDVLVAVLDESAADRVANRKTTSAETEMAMMTSASPSATTDAEASPTASPSEGTNALASEPTPESSASAGASPSPSEATSPSPSPTDSPSESTSPSSSPTPSPTASESTSASPSASPTPSSEPVPTSSPGRKYESVEPTEAPSGAGTASPAPATEPAPTPSG